MKAQLFYERMINQLNLQKDCLGISYAVLSDKSGVSEPTIKRILSGKHPSSHFDHVVAIADALGVDLAAKPKDAENMRRNQAEHKAEQLVRLVRGNSALEGQSISRTAYKRMISKTTNELLSGSKQALWG